MHVRYFLLWFILLQISCSHHKTPVDQFLDKIEQLTTKQEQKNIVASKDIIDLKTRFHKGMSLLFKQTISLPPAEVNMFLSDSLKLTDIDDKRLALLLAFKNKLDNTTVDFEAIKKKISKFNEWDARRCEEDTKKEIETQSAIAEENYSKYKVGDNLTLLLPLMRSGNQKTVYLNNFYGKKDYTDTLFLKCVVLKKEHYKSKFKLTPDEYYFRLRITEAHNNELNLVDKAYSKGNTILLPVYDYGRAIAN